MAPAIPAENDPKSLLDNDDSKKSSLIPSGLFSRENVLAGIAVRILYRGLPCRQ